MTVFDNDVPLPRRSGLFVGMEPGQSLFVEGEGNRDRSANAARNHAHRHGWKVSIRTVEGGVRIWRLR